LLALLFGSLSVGEEILKIYVPRLKKYSYSALVVIGLFIQVALSAGIVENNRLVYASVYEAVRDPVVQNAELIAYSDETGVSNWYLRGNGIYYNQDLTSQEQLDWLRDNSVDYILWTNEHNEEQELTVVTDGEYSGYFEPVAQYVYSIGSQRRVSTVYRVTL
jgi:hypothetical protein